MGLFAPEIRKQLQSVSALATGTLLDVGCGSKPYRGVFGNVDAYIGVDRPSELDACRPNRLKRERVIDVIGSADALPFAACSFRTVLSTQLIEHLPDPQLFFGEAARVLKPGGHLILTFPLINPLHSQPYDFFRYTEHAIERLCEPCGLRVARTVKMGGAWLAVGYLVRHCLYADSDRARSRAVRYVTRFLGTKLYRFLEWLDRTDCHPEAPLNYLVVATREG